MFGDERARRRRNARDLERRMRELDELDRRFGLGALPGTTGPREVRRTRRRGRGMWVSVLTVALLCVVVALHPGPQAATVRDLVSGGLSRAGLVSPSAGDGSFAFLATQSGTTRPVGYDPCTPITVAVNPDGAPSGWETLVGRALEHVGSPSGLELAYAGESAARDVDEQQDTDATVLVLWATEEEFPALEGDVAGIGGSSAVRRAGRVEYVSGQVVLDSEAFGRLDGDLQVALDQAVVDHELAHVVGLDHVDDTGELMNPETGRQLSWGPGDLEGLRRLGELPCR